MTAWIARRFRVFETPGDPRPLALFRLLFYAGLALHFGPSFLAFGDNYAASAPRVEAWSRLAFVSLPVLPVRAVAALAVATGVAWTCGILGLRPRLAAAGTGLGLYTFASFNARNTQTLALGSVWAILTIWAVTGGGDGAFALRLGPRDRRARVHLDGARTRYLVAGQLLLSLLFAGLEKIAAGWPFSNPMAVLLKSPPHFIMRGPLAGLGDPGASIAGMVLGVCTLALELSIPILALFRRTRTLAAVAMAGFFVVVIASMQVPPLFFCIYFGGALLILDDARYLQVIGNWGGSEFNSASPDRQSRG